MKEILGIKFFQNGEIFGKKQIDDIGRIMDAANRGFLDHNQMIRYVDSELRINMVEETKTPSTFFVRLPECAVFRSFTYEKISPDSWEMRGWPEIWAKTENDYFVFLIPAYKGWIVTNVSPDELEYDIQKGVCVPVDVTKLDTYYITKHEALESILEDTCLEQTNWKYANGKRPLPF